MYCYYIVNKAHNILDGNSLGGCSGRGNEYGKKSYQNVKNALKQYVMKGHQTFKVVETKSQKYIVCCPNI